MKKITLLIASLLVLFLLCSCNQEQTQLSADSLDSFSTLHKEVQEEPKDDKIFQTSRLTHKPNEEVSTSAPQFKLKNQVVTIPTDSIEVTLNEYGLELPINGATGYTSISMPLYSSNTKDAIITTLEAGSAFQILSEELDMWLVNSNGTMGWLEHKYCLINLPDVIPSMVYDNTNSYRSMYRSVGYPLEGITDEVLYNAEAYSLRFEETQYLMPVLYEMSKKICAAQNTALKNGQSLKLYEGFRPSETQTKICTVLGELIKSNNEVYEHVCSSPWGKGWFISTGISNHQRGCAIDVSLVNVSSAEQKKCGNYSYVDVTEYEELEMPTQMHELSNLAVTFVSPVDSKSKTAWKSATLAPSMTEAAMQLQEYCTASGLTPLSSEWWHFNDLYARENVGKNSSDGKFMITENCSQIPE